MERQLTRLLQSVEGTSKILILPHNDPDPDAIASAVALRHLLAEQAGVDSRIAYKGIIGRAENRALVRYLDYPLQRLTGADLRQAWPIALVDTQPGAGNNALPAHVAPAIVFDHHPYREATAGAAFADVRPGLGSTSTLLVEYLQAAGIEPSPPLATALFYGIKTDTLGLGRGAGRPMSPRTFISSPDRRPSPHRDRARQSGRRVLCRIGCGAARGSGI